MSTRSFSFLVLLVLLISLNSTKTTFSQCCSTGSPVGASVYVGVLSKNTLRVVGYYRYNYSDTYYHNAETSNENTALKYASYNFSGIGFGYGLTKRLTLEADFGYFFNKTQQFNDIISEADSANHGKVKGYGLSNGGITLKYGAYVNPAKQAEITLGAGFRYPFTMEPQLVDGVQLNRDVQPSTNAFAASGMFFFNKGFPAITLRLFSINRYDYNFEGNNGYKYGNILLNSVFVSKKIAKYFFGILQIRSEWKTNDQDNGENVVNSGFVLLTLSPTLSYSIVGEWNLTMLCDIPVYKNYNGLQMTPKYSFAVSLSRDFNLGRKSKATKDIKTTH
jgi:hypothetical protein